MAPGVRSVPVAHNGGVNAQGSGRATPSERLWARRDEWDGEESVHAVLAAQARDPMTLQRTAERILGGLPLREAAADFLDDLRWARDAPDVEQRVTTAPPPAGANADAYLAALAEHVASRHGIAVPVWTGRPERYLDHFWWPSRTEGLQARALVESPAAFRRRGIFIGRSTLQRV